MAACSSVFLLLLVINFLGYFSEVTSVSLTKTAVQLEPAPVLKTSDFTTFKSKMAKVMGVSEVTLDSKQIQEWYNKEIKTTGKVIDFNNVETMNNISAILLSMICASCNNNCECLLLHGCTVPCP